jgi:hypothetical protein
VSVASTLASTFVLVFVAEWGDKSFFSTIGTFFTTIPYKGEISIFTTNIDTWFHVLLQHLLQLHPLQVSLLGHSLVMVLQHW